MQFVINFNEIDLADYVDFENEYRDEPLLLKDVFKDEIIRQFVAKVNYDIEVKRYIQDNIDKHLYQKIYAYKDDAAIKVIVNQIIEEKLKATGTFIFLKEYAKNVESVVDDYLKKSRQEIERAMQTSMRMQIETVLNELYKGSKMGEFINIEKLTAHIHQVLGEEMTGDAQ